MDITKLLNTIMMLLEENKRLQNKLCVANALLDIRENLIAKIINQKKLKVNNKMFISGIIVFLFRDKNTHWFIFC